MMASSEPWLTLHRTFDAALPVLRDPGKETYIVRDDAGMAAFIILDMRGPLAGYIQTVCVRADQRGKGIGSVLIEWAERRILTESPNVFMCVSSFNIAARRLYDRLGYQVVGTLHGYIVPEYDEILLRKTVGPWDGFRHNCPAERPA